jgi:hypothetical protein
MPTHVHFHDFLSDDKKPFEEAKHKRSHGKFATMAGGGAQQKNPGLREHKPPKTVSRHPRPQPQAQSRLSTFKAGAAARIAQAVAKAKGQVKGLGQEAFAIPHDVEILTKGFDSPNTPLRQKLGATLVKNAGGYLREMGVEAAGTVRHAGAGLKNMAQGLPMDDRQQEAWKAIGRKVVISTLMRSLDIAVPGAGVLAEVAGHAVGHVASQVAGHAIDHVTQHVVQQIAEVVVEHAAEEHELKLMGGIGRAGRHLLGRQRRLQQQQRQDHAFSDAGQPSDQECMKLLADWMQTLAKSLATAPIDMKQIMATAPKSNGDSARFGPLFGGLRSSGNALRPVRDEGTTEGAKKGWRKRKYGGAGTAAAAPQLRKATPPPAAEPPKAKPSFEEMRAHRLDMPTPQSKPKQAPRQKPVAPRATGKAPLDPSLGFRQSFNFQGKPRSEKSRSSSVPALPVRETVSLAQRGREGPAKEQRETTARAQRAELKSLHQRHTAGESLSDKEKRRMAALMREHGVGGMATPTAAPNPPKQFLRTRGGRRWLSRN